MVFPLFVGNKKGAGAPWADQKQLMKD